MGEALPCPDPVATAPDRARGRTLPRRLGDRRGGEIGPSPDPVTRPDLLGGRRCGASPSYHTRSGEGRCPSPAYEDPGGPSPVRIWPLAAGSGRGKRPLPRSGLGRISEGGGAVAPPPPSSGSNCQM